MFDLQLCLSGCHSENQMLDLIQVSRLANLHPKDFHLIAEMQASFFIEAVFGA